MNGFQTPSRLLFTAVLLVASITTSGCGRAREVPRYRGKTLTEWFLQMEDRDMATSLEAAEAIGEVGTDALPELLKRIGRDWPGFISPTSVLGAIALQSPASFCLVADALSEQVRRSRGAKRYAAAELLLRISAEVPEHLSGSQSSAATAFPELMSMSLETTRRDVAAAAEFIVADRNAPAALIDQARDVGNSLGAWDAIIDRAKSTGEATLAPSSAPVPAAELVPESPSPTGVPGRRAESPRSTKASPRLQPAEGWKIVHRWTGRGEEPRPRFLMTEQSWRVRWETWSQDGEPHVFALWVRHLEGLGTRVASVEGAGQGVTEFDVGGNYVVEIIGSQQFYDIVVEIPGP